MIRKFIDFEYFKTEIESPLVKKFESEIENHFSYLAKIASEAVFQALNIPFIVFENIPSAQAKAAIKQATGYMVEHYYKNTTNFANISTTKSTGDVSETITFIEGFNPSVIPDFIAGILANEGLYVTIYNDEYEFQAGEEIADYQVLSTSTRENLISKNQLDINTQNDIDIIDLKDRTSTLETEIDTKVDQSVYEAEQAAQDTEIDNVENIANQNRELIEDIAGSLNSGGIATETFRTPFDNVDESIGRVIITQTGININPLVRIQPTRPEKLTYTQETGFKTFDVKDNGVLTVFLTGDLKRFNTTGVVKIKVDLIDINGNTVVDTITKTYDFTTNDIYATQVAELTYEVSNISPTNLTRRFYVKIATVTAGNDLYILGGANTSVSLGLSGGVASVATTDDVINTSNVIGITATDALNSLNDTNIQQSTDILQNTSNIANNTLSIMDLVEEDVAINAKLDEIYNQLVED